MNISRHGAYCTIVLFKMLLPCFVGLAVLAGCGSNHRYYVKQNIELTARLRHGEASYVDVHIGTPAQPFDQNLNTYGDVVVELSKNDVARLADLTVANLLKASTSTKNLDKVGYDTGWPKGSQRITIGTRIFAVVNKDRILALSANSVGLREGEPGARFGRKGLDDLYSMPLSQEQVEAIFGKPDKQNDVFHQ